MASRETNLVSGFLDSVEAGPERPAAVVGDERLSYRDLAGRAGGIGSCLDGLERGNPLIGLLAYRSVTAYAGILSILARGRGYVPLNPRFPAQRNGRMLALAEPDVVVVGAECLGHLEELLPLVEKPTAFILPGGADAAEWTERAPDHAFVTLDPEAGELAAKPVAADCLAYVLFTSGSTGAPKGVMVTHANVLDYLRYVRDNFDFDESDRFSQNFDLTFDLSVHDIFVPLQVGARVCCPTVAETKLPGAYIRKHEITQWFAVPSVTSTMVQLRLARPGAYPSIRRSLFCGEALPLGTARAWQAAAPNSKLVNLYGPTEATIAITRFDVTPDIAEEDCPGGVIPIGKVFPGQRTRIVGEDGRSVAPGEEGELCVSGTQVTRGYWKDEPKTREQFVTLPEDGDRIWYRTGDIAVEAADGLLHYVGRIDHQVKIMGYRVELHEIEHHLRRVSGCDAVAVIPWPLHEGAAQAVEAFVAGTGERPLDQVRLIREMGDHLPSYMVPRSIRQIDALPLNANGKLDRAALIERYLT